MVRLTNTKKLNYLQKIYEIDSRTNTLAYLSRASVMKKSCLTLTPAAVFTTLHFHRDSQMGPIS